MNITRELIITDMDPKTRLISHEFINVLPQRAYNITDLFSKNPVYTPAKGDRIWFYPGCDIPRFKVKQFCINNDVAVVKYAEKASVKFIGPTSIMELIKGRFVTTIVKADFLAWFDRIMCNSYITLREDIVKNTSDVIYIDNSTFNKFKSKDLFANNILKAENEYLQINYMQEDSYALFIKMQEDPLLRSQDDLLNLLNTGVILDEQMYNDIHRLFESTDKENTKLAMEAMANCDFQQSAVYLLLLMKEYGQKISDSGNRHHVNFKSLVKYFQIRNLENMTVDSMIDSLRCQKLLSVNNLNRLMPLAMERIREKGDMQNIKIKDVELSEEAELSVAENILDQQISTPSVPVPETPEPTDLFIP